MLGVTTIGPHYAYSAELPGSHHQRFLAHPLTRLPLVEWLGILEIKRHFLVVNTNFAFARSLQSNSAFYD